MCGGVGASWMEKNMHELFKIRVRKMNKKQNKISSQKIKNKKTNHVRNKIIVFKKYAVTKNIEGKSSDRNTKHNIFC